MHTYAGIAALTLTGTASANGKLPALGSWVSGTGVWSTAQVADGGDPRSAANLFAGLEAALDRINALAWRNINIIEGGAYTWTTGITTANAWQFNGATLFNAPVQVAGSYGIEFLSGATAFFDPGAHATFSGTGPTPTATLGVNALWSTNIVKAWASITTNGANAVALNDGYGIASVAIGTIGSTPAIIVTLKLPMINETFSVQVTNMDGTNVVTSYSALVTSDSMFSITGTAIVFSGSPLVAAAQAVAWGSVVTTISIQVIGRQS